MNYIASNTQLNISFAISSLAQYSVKPGLSHWREFNKVWKYIRSTQEIQLTLEVKDPNIFLSIYSNATWGDDPDTRISQSGYICYLFGNPIS